MGASNTKEAFRTAVLDLVNNQQVCEEGGGGARDLGVRVCRAWEAEFWVWSELRQDFL